MAAADGRNIRVVMKGRMDLCDEPAFSMRQFLREREALLIHFNTPMSNHATGFPDDLRQAAGLRGPALSFSTIQAHDAIASAAGSVGLVVDINDINSVVTVGSDDDGTTTLPNGEIISGGFAPTASTCAASIDERESCNEWLVRNYVPIGIFIFSNPSIFVRRPGNQGLIGTAVPTILDAFPVERIFSAHNGQFLEYNRAMGRWQPVVYGAIIPE